MNPVKIYTWNFKGYLSNSCKFELHYAICCYDKCTTGVISALHRSAYKQKGLGIVISALHRRLIQQQYCRV